jgi:hypothetical protein
MILSKLILGTVQFGLNDGIADSRYSKPQTSADRIRAALSGPTPNRMPFAPTLQKTAKRLVCKNGGPTTVSFVGGLASGSHVTVAIERNHPCPM